MRGLQDLRRGNLHPPRENGLDRLKTRTEDTTWHRRMRILEWSGIYTRSWLRLTSNRLMNGGRCTTAKWVKKIHLLLRYRHHLMRLPGEYGGGYKMCQDDEDLRERQVMWSRLLLLVTCGLFALGCGWLLLVSLTQAVQSVLTVMPR